MVDRQNEPENCKCLILWILSEGRHVVTLQRAYKIYVNRFRKFQRNYTFTINPFSLNLFFLYFPTLEKAQRIKTLVGCFFFLIKCYLVLFFPSQPGYKTLSIYNYIIPTRTRFSLVIRKSTEPLGTTLPLYSCNISKSFVKNFSFFVKFFFLKGFINCLWLFHLHKLVT